MLSRIQLSRVGMFADRLLMVRVCAVVTLSVLLLGASSQQVGFTEPDSELPSIPTLTANPVQTVELSTGPTGRVSTFKSYKCLYIASLGFLQIFGIVCSCIFSCHVHRTVRLSATMKGSRYYFDRGSVR